MARRRSQYIPPDPKPYRPCNFDGYSLEDLTDEGTLGRLGVRIDDDEYLRRLIQQADRHIIGEPADLILWALYQQITGHLTEDDKVIIRQWRTDVWQPEWDFSEGTLHYQRRLTKQAQEDIKRIELLP